MRAVKAGVCLMLLMPVCISMYAQQPLSLHQAMDSMEKNYPSLQIRQSLVHAAEAYSKQVSHERTPSLKLMEEFAGGTNNNIPGSLFQNGILPGVTGGTRDQNISDVQFGNLVIGLLNWEMINFGAYRARDEQAAANITVQQNDLKREHFLLQGAVLNAYFNVLKNYYLVQYSRRAVERIDTIRQAIAAYVQNGLRPGVDSSVANAELSKARLNLVETLRQLAQAKSDLSLVTGIDTSVIIADTDNAFTPSLVNRLNGDNLLQSHPLLQYYESAFRYNRAAENAIRKNYLPKISLLGSVWMRGSTIDAEDNFKHPVSNAFTENRYNYLAGIALTYNPFDLRKKHDQLAVQRFQTESSQQQVDLQKTQLQAAVQKAAIDVNSAQQKLNEIPVQLKAANDAYDQRLALYQAGLANIIDVVNAFYVLNRAEIDLVQTRAEYWQAVFQKAYAGNQINQLLSLLK